jgi:2-polyprenyl-6-methoxyphenol hydroxylase-like FAD-dependent oxidoreductase
VQTYVRGRVALTGDAAHLMTPMLAQGCSQALEDALELGRAIGAVARRLCLVHRRLLSVARPDMPVATPMPLPPAGACGPTSEALAEYQRVRHPQASRVQAASVQVSRNQPADNAAPIRAALNPSL